MPRPSCLHPDLVGSGSRRSVPLCLPSAPWEEDEIRRDRVEPQSVSLSWREPVPAGAPGANGTEYEIRYYEKVSLVDPGLPASPSLSPLPFQTQLRPPEVFLYPFCSPLLTGPWTAPFAFLV